MESRNLLRAACSSLAAALLFTVSTSTETFAKNQSTSTHKQASNKKDKGKPPPHWQVKHAQEPMVLESQGVFWVGGEIVDRTDPAFAGRKTITGAAYVEYFIPKKKRKNAVPIVITHSSISGVFFQTKGDGGEGWVQYFVRQGFPVYVADPPGTGRAGFDIDQANMAATGRIAPLASNPIARGDSQSWPQWNVGPAFGQLGSGVRGGSGNAMPTDEENLRRFLAAQLPIGPNPQPSIAGGTEATKAAITALLEKTGPAIFVGWSGGGTLAETLVNVRPDLFKAIISLEGLNSSCNPNPGGTPPAVVDPVTVATLVNNKIPFVNLNSTVGHSGRNPGGYGIFWCQALIDQIKAAGGDATQIQSPDVGVTGNSHPMFWENGSLKLAQVLVNWIDRHVKVSRHHDDDDDDHHHGHR